MALPVLLRLWQPGDPCRPVTATRYGRTTAVTAHERHCLWYRVFRAQAVRVIVMREPRKPRLLAGTPRQRIEHSC